MGAKYFRILAGGGAGESTSISSSLSSLSSLSLSSSLLDESSFGFKTETAFGFSTSSSESELDFSSSLDKINSLLLNDSAKGCFAAFFAATSFVLDFEEDFGFARAFSAIFSSEGMFVFTDRN